MIWYHCNSNGRIKSIKKVFVHQKIEKIIYVNTEIVGESCDIFSFKEKGVVKEEMF